MGSVNNVLVDWEMKGKRVGPGPKAREVSQSESGVESTVVAVFLATPGHRVFRRTAVRSDHYSPDQPWP